MLKEVLHENGAFNLLQITEDANSQFVAFLQLCQAEKLQVALSVVTNNDGKFLLCVQSQNDGYIIDLELVSSPSYERFFANMSCICDTEKDLPFLLKHLPMSKDKIDDAKVLKGLVKFSENKVSNVRINCPKYDDISFPYVRSVVYRGIEGLCAVAEMKKLLSCNIQQQIYISIINERYKTATLYNNGVSLSEISDLYNTLSHEQQGTMNEIYEIVKNIALQNKVPNSSVISLSALEMLILKSPVNFEDMTHIFGFNKKYVHNAICRKILNIFENRSVKLKRNFGLETAIDLILFNCGEKHGIDKNLIASKREIVAYLNENLNVDFLKGWKKEVFGNCILAFMQGRSVISCKNQRIVLK